MHATKLWDLPCMADLKATTEFTLWFVADFYQDADVEGMPSCLGDGDMCCVLSTEDNLWYRAQVSISSSSVYKTIVHKDR